MKHNVVESSSKHSDWGGLVEVRDNGSIKKENLLFLGIVKERGGSGNIFHEAYRKGEKG